MPELQDASTDSATAVALTFSGFNKVTTMSVLVTVRLMTVFVDRF
jgi:glyceraldehyde-3-phosphate dehydrogenase/erythrose-4-phosphate dehydrogenase